MYKEGKVTLSKASELAGSDTISFKEILKDRESRPKSMWITKKNCKKGQDCSVSDVKGWKKHLYS